MRLVQQEGEEPVGPWVRPILGGEAVLFSERAPGKEENEDAVLVLELPGRAVLAVADGMGGLNAGRRASRAALEALDAVLQRGLGEGMSLQHAALDGLQAANRAILELALGAGSTLAAALLEDGTVRAVHVGDAFLLQVGQRGRIKQQTVAHSPTGYAVEAGFLDEEAALRHAERHYVSNHLGMEGMRIEVGAAVRLAPRDTVLVASDGLADNLRVPEIVAAIRAGPLERAAATLADAARARMVGGDGDAPGHPDDLSFLLYRPGR